MRYAIPDNKKLVHEQVIPVRWGDMDALRHLNNTTYFRYMETSRIDWMRSIGMDFEAEEGVVVLNAFCNFHQQIRYPADVLIKTYVSDLARTTFESWSTMERVDQPGVVCADGGSTIVWVNFREEKAAPVPGWLRALLG